MRYFEKKKQKKQHFFSFTITILDHTLYGKVKSVNVIGTYEPGSSPIAFHDFFEVRCRLWNVSSETTKRELSILSCLNSQTYREIKISFSNENPKFEEQTYKSTVNFRITRSRKREFVQSDEKISTSKVSDP